MQPQVTAPGPDLAKNLHEPHYPGSIYGPNPGDIQENQDGAIGGGSDNGIPQG
jgi:hypothetical protein